MNNNNDNNNDNNNNNNGNNNDKFSCGFQFSQVGLSQNVFQSYPQLHPFIL